MLINCVAYQDGRKLADIEKREISDYLARPGCFVWVALREPSEGELEEMREEFDLHPLALEDASHGHQRPKIEEYGDSLFVVMTITELTPTDELKLGEMNVFVGRNYILSIRQGTERGFQEVRARCEREPELLRYGSGYVLYALMDTVVDRYFPVLDSIEMELEAIESRLFEGTAHAGTVRGNIEALYFVKQKLTTLKHASGPLQEYAGKLYGGRVPHVCSGLGEYFRDIFDHLTRINQSIDTARDTVTTAIQVNLAMITIGETEVTKRLAAWAALIAVPTFISSLYGMNFKNMPELEWTFGYPLSLATMAAIDVYFWYRFRKAGWL
jgi:magnesium transporter